MLAGIEYHDFITSLSFFMIMFIFCLIQACDWYMNYLRHGISLKKAITIHYFIQQNVLCNIESFIFDVVKSFEQATLYLNYAC